MVLSLLVEEEDGLLEQYINGSLFHLGTPLLSTPPSLPSAEV